MCGGDSGWFWILRSRPLMATKIIMVEIVSMRLLDLYMMMSDYVHCRDDGGEEYETFGPLHEVKNHLFPFFLLVLRGHVVFPLRLCTVSNNMATLSEQVEASSCPCVKWKYLWYTPSSSEGRFLLEDLRTSRLFYQPGLDRHGAKITMTIWFG